MNDALFLTKSTPVTEQYFLSCACIKRVQQLATGWTVRGSNPGRGEVFRTRPILALEPIQLPIQWVPGISRG
jgi:hypothetical protein